MKRQFLQPVLQRHAQHHPSAQLRHGTPLGRTRKILLCQFIHINCFHTSCLLPSCLRTDTRGLPYGSY
nr:MAG TPA: hypothetical protein [Caudoviricetes sp.]